MDINNNKIIRSRLVLCLSAVIRHAWHNVLDINCQINKQFICVCIKGKLYECVIHNMAPARMVRCKLCDAACNSPSERTRASCAFMHRGMHFGHAENSHLKPEEKEQERGESESERESGKETLRLSCLPIIIHVYTYVGCIYKRNALRLELRVKKSFERNLKNFWYIFATECRQFSCSFKSQNIPISPYCIYEQRSNSPNYKISLNSQRLFCVFINSTQTLPRHWKSEKIVMQLVSVPRSCSFLFSPDIFHFNAILWRLV